VLDCQIESNQCLGNAALTARATCGPLVSRLDRNAAVGGNGRYGLTNDVKSHSQGFKRVPAPKADTATVLIVRYMIVEAWVGANDVLLCECVWNEKGRASQQRSTTRNNGARECTATRANAMQFELSTYAIPLHSSSFLLYPSSSSFPKPHLFIPLPNQHSTHPNQHLSIAHHVRCS
jgi:hypothetical protein